MADICYNEVKKKQEFDSILGIYEKMNFYQCRGSIYLVMFLKLIFRLILSALDFSSLLMKTNNVAIFK